MRSCALLPETNLADFGLYNIFHKKHDIWAEDRYQSKLHLETIQYHSPSL